MGATNMFTPSHVLAFNDLDGSPMVRVRLGNARRSAVLSAVDHARVTTVMGVNLDWFLDTTGRPHVAVRSRTTRQVATVARFLLGTVPRGRIHYADGDHLNLRAGNICAGLAPGSRGPKVLPEPEHDLAFYRMRDKVPLVGVRVDGAKKRAFMERMAYDAHVAAVGVRPWFVHPKRGKGRRVCYESALPGQIIAVGSVLSGGAADESVGHRDGNFLNLRIGNLCRVSGDERDQGGASLTVSL